MYTVLGILNLAAKYFPWARAQLFVLKNLLRIITRSRFLQAKASKKYSEDISIKRKQLPTSMYYRMKNTKAVVKAQFVYANNLQIIIPEQATTAVYTIYKYLAKKRTVEMPNWPYRSKNTNLTIIR